MRGKDSFPLREALALRITPAYAGKSLFRISDDTLIFGSPPPMRGKVLRTLGKLGKVGITPAYAGKRVDDLSDQSEEEDHPRLCGEKAFSPMPP